MASPRFRLQSLRIEGFKAFTASQEIQFGGQHAFIFGPNGRGKSSIIDAIVWCFWGAAPGQGDTEFANTFYTGACQVDMTLDGPGGQLRVL